MISSTPERLSCADTARLVRKVLAHAWPTVKFSVRSHVYSGGASVRVHWTDGPSTASVERLVKPYEGATFDGMIDLKTHHDTILVGSHGPRLVSFGADFIFCGRTISQEPERRQEAERMIRDRCRVVEGRFGGDWIENLAAQMVWALDFQQGTTLEDTFRTVVLRERGQS